MKVITTALAIAAIFFTTANSLDLSSLDLSWSPHPVIFNWSTTEKTVANCNEKFYAGLFTELILSCGNGHKHFAIRHIGTGTNGGNKGLHRTWKFNYSTDCQDVRMVFASNGELIIRDNNSQNVCW